MNWETILLVLPIVSALGTLGAAIGAFCSARATRSAAEAQLFSRFMEEYGGPQMGIALRTLVNWKAEWGDKFEEMYREGLRKADPNAHKVDQARRYVISYFFKALSLHRERLVKPWFLKAVAAVRGHYGINILYDIVEPLETALNPDYDKSVFEQLRQICGRTGTGWSYEQIPVPPGLTEPAFEKEKR